MQSSALTYNCSRYLRRSIIAEVAQNDHLLVPETNAWFFNKTSLEDLVSGVKPLASIEDLALDDLTPEEANSFLHAIQE